MLIRRGRGWRWGEEAVLKTFIVCAFGGNGKNMFIVAIKPESSPGEYLSQI